MNFLLQRMASFCGVTILTTNLEDTLDTAFKGRLTFRLHFEKPDARARTALWRKSFPPNCPLSEDVDLELLGRSYEFTGGNIRNAALRAAFLVASNGHIIDMMT